MDDIPVWLNSQFLEKALNSESDVECRIVSSTVTIATAPGDNYGSDIYRASLMISRNGEQENKWVIIKTEIRNEEMRKILTDLNAFTKEMIVFTEVIPHLQDLVRRALPDNYRPYSAICYHAHRDHPQTLVLEDLKVAGFRMATTSQPLDTDHCFLIANTLAMYHAASAVFNEKSSRKLQNMFNESIYSRKWKDVILQMHGRGIKSLIAEAENWPECRGEILNKLHGLLDNLAETVEEAVDLAGEDFGVLTHQDVWVKNLMFRYTENKEVVDVRFLDFQTCHWTSPVIDLLYFINANATMEHVRNPEIIIEEYYSGLIDTFTALGASHLCPSKLHLYQQCDKRCKFGVVTGLVVRNGILGESASADAVEKLLSDDKINFGEPYKKDAREMLSIFHERGWL